MHPRFNVMLVGGDGRARLQPAEGVDLRWYGSSRHRGNGALRSALAVIDSGSVDAVILLIRWLGHSACHALRAACRRASIPCTVVVGGESAAMRAVLELAGGQR